MPKERNIIAIGGGGFGANPGQGIIEEYILKQTKKKKPNICFIPTATGDNEAYKVNYYATFSKLQCNPTHLDFFKRTPDLNKLTTCLYANFFSLNFPPSEKLSGVKFKIPIIFGIFLKLKLKKFFFFLITILRSLLTFFFKNEGSFLIFFI